MSVAPARTAEWRRRVWCCLLIVFSCALQCAPAFSLEKKDAGAIGTAAPELTGGVGWLNTDKPLTLKELRGKIVILDFWTFCCINCMHVLPQLHELEKKFPHELVIVGVHSGKFSNEKQDDPIRKAILRYGIEHPVVNDAEMKLWNAYNVKAWPTLVLIDPDGNISAVRSGETVSPFFDTGIRHLIDVYGKSGKLDHRPVHFALEKDKIAQSPLSFPGKIAADPASKRLFISDSGHNRIIVASTDGRVKDVIGSGASGSANGTYAQASFRHPQGLVYADGKLYVADTENHLIRLIDLQAKTVKTIAGTGVQGDRSMRPLQPTEAVRVPLNSPWDVTLIGRALYIAMAGAHQLWRMDLDKSTVGVYAGTGNESIIDGPAVHANLAQPSGITTDGKNLYFADSEVSAIRKDDIPDNDQITTIVGGIGLFDFGDKDGDNKTARLQHPLAVLWHNGKLYVADSYNHKIKIVDPVNRTIATLCGSGKPGFADGKNPQFSEPGGLAAVGNTLYIADTNNSKIRTIDLKTKTVGTLNLTGFPKSK
ncbi:MAG TPA: thioredoxin-like domain-containing protein [Planktothrix sp.]|jgi:DNA-binding beta-propeller fold protein YncE